MNNKKYSKNQSQMTDEEVEKELKKFHYNNCKTVI